HATLVSKKTCEYLQAQKKSSCPLPAETTPQIPSQHDIRNCEQQCTVAKVAISAPDTRRSMRNLPLSNRFQEGFRFFQSRASPPTHICTPSTVLQRSQKYYRHIPIRVKTKLTCRHCPTLCKTYCLADGII